jgi:hypothetical protein
VHGRPGGTLKRLIDDVGRLSLARHTFDRLVVGHGSPLREGAREAMLGAY